MNKKYILVLFFLLFSLFTSGCNTKYGYVNLQTWNNISIYIDNEYKGDAGEGITKLKVEEGNHIIKISGDSKDGDWHYEIEKSVYVGADMEITVSLVPNQSPTEQRKNKEKTIQEQEDKIKQEKLKEAKKYGCTSIEEYNTYIQLNKIIDEYKLSLEDIYKLKKEIIKENGYMVNNDYIDLIDYQLNKTALTINIKNKTKDVITYFWSYFNFTDENLKYLGSFKTYKEYIEIKPFSSEKFVINISSDLYRNFVNSKKIYLFMDVDSIRYKDSIGTVSKNIKSSRSLRNEITKISNENIFNIEEKIKQQDNELLKICK